MVLYIRGAVTGIRLTWECSLDFSNCWFGISIWEALSLPLHCLPILWQKLRILAKPSSAFFSTTQITFLFVWHTILSQFKQPAGYIWAKNVLFGPSKALLFIPFWSLPLLHSYSLIIGKPMLYSPREWLYLQLTPSVVLWASTHVLWHTFYTHKCACLKKCNFETLKLNK